MFTHVRICLVVGMSLSKEGQQGRWGQAEGFRRVLRYGTASEDREGDAEQETMGLQWPPFWSNLGVQEGRDSGSSSPIYSSLSLLIEPCSA